MFVTVVVLKETANAICSSQCEKSRNFSGVEILWKDTVSHSFGRFAQNYAETVPFDKISTPEN